jgi:hypothetical protein
MLILTTLKYYFAPPIFVLETIQEIFNNMALYLSFFFLFVNKNVIDLYKAANILSGIRRISQIDMIKKRFVF